MGATGSFPGASMGYSRTAPPVSKSGGIDPNSTLMGASMATSAMSAVTTAFTQSNAIKAQGAYQSAVADANARIAGVESSEALEAGDLAASRKNLETKGAVGTERAAQGASGTDVSGGSNALTRISTELAGRMDELTIRNNAARQAWGYQTAAIQDNFQGQFAKMTAASQSQQTLLSGGIGAIQGPLSIESNYLRWSRYMGGGGGGSNSRPFNMSTN